MPILPRSTTPAVGLAHDAQRGTLRRVRTHAIADGRRAGRERQEPPGAHDVLRDRPRHCRSAPADALRCLHRAQHAERNQMSIGRRMRDVAGAEECRRRETPAHADEIVGTLRHHVAPGQPPSRQGFSTMSCHAGSKCRSYQATYSSTMARVAGCVVTSSTAPSPMTQTLRPSRSASRYSAPVRSLRWHLAPPSRRGSRARCDRWSPACRARARRAAPAHA